MERSWPSQRCLVDQYDGGQQAEPLDGKGDVGQVGDGAVAVLKIEGIEELLGALGADFGERLAHGERGAGVLGHGIGQHLGVGAVDGEDVGLVAGAGGRKDSLDMGVGSRTEYGMRGSCGCASCDLVQRHRRRCRRTPDDKLEWGSAGAGNAGVLIRTSHRPRPLPSGRWA